MRTTRSLSVFAIVLFALFFLSGSSYSDPLDNWHWRSPVPTGNDLAAVTYGNGIFVAVGGAGTILTSPDGVTWTQRVSGDYTLLNAVTHGNGTFIAVGENGTILTSQDGVTWTKISSEIESSIRGVSFGNNIFVAVGGNGSDGCYCTRLPIDPPPPPCPPCPAIILTSPDGINWTSKILGLVEFGLTGVTYGNGVFVAFDPFDSIFISHNGVDWSSSPGRLKALTFGGGIFVGIGSDNTVQTSPDGVTWAARTTLQFAYALNAVSYGNGTFIAVGWNTILTSTDGETWIKAIPWVAGDYNFLNRFEGVTYGNGTFVVVGEYGTILTSTDGGTWTAQTSRVTSELLRAVAYGNGTFVAVGHGAGGLGLGGIIVSSLDGATWILRSSGKSSGISYALYEVAYGNGIFVAVGWDQSKGHGGILVSPDGITWTTTRVWPHSLGGVTYGNGKFVAAGYLTILTSLDGVIWTKKSTVDADLYAVTYGNGTFVAVGYCGTSDCVRILTSQDAVNWTRRAGPGPSLFGITYGNGTFVAVGSEGTILTSLDGITWTQRRGIISYLSGVTYVLGAFVAVGEYGTIIQSDALPIPQISVNPISHHFGKVNAMGTSAPQVFAITNTGTADLALETILLTGTNVSEFKKQIDNCSGKTILPSESCTVNIVFSPTSAGTKSANLFIQSNDPENNPVRIQLSGIGLITLIFPSSETHFDSCSLYSPPTFSWIVGDTFRTLELQFSSDQNFSSIPVKAKVAGTAAEVVIKSNLWKNVLSIPGASGGTVYWRAVGTRADRTTAVSEVHSIIIEPAQPVTNPSISPTNKNSLPQLSWNNNCNNKFKVWFGSNNSSSRRTTLAFNVKNPTNNGGLFQKTLTPGQWTAVKNLVKNAVDQTTYWYVESWDALGRHSQTDVMNFVLIE